jgi:hypothetical protein
MCTPPVCQYVCTSPSTNDRQWIVTSKRRPGARLISFLDFLLTDRKYKVVVVVTESRETSMVAVVVTPNTRFGTRRLRELVVDVAVVMDDS